MAQLTCIHIERGQQCQKPVFNVRTNGWLCISHYRMQQNSMPAKPRQPQPRWKGLPLTRDEDIINDIIQTDKQAIATKGIRVVRFGALDPSYIRYVGN